MTLRRGTLFLYNEVFVWGGIPDMAVQVERGDKLTLTDAQLTRCLKDFPFHEALVNVFFSLVSLITIHVFKV